MNPIQEPVECPICFLAIGEKNSMTTECGHSFHSSCILKNVSVNGFACPCCRFKMAEAQNVWDDDDSSIPSLISSHSDDDDSDIIEEPFSDDSLRGLRLLTSLLEGFEQDQADVVAEFQYVEGNSEAEAEAEPEPEPEYVTGIAPPHSYVSSCLREQGVTFEQLVAWIAADHEEYIIGEQENDLNAFSGDIWHKMREVIENYTPPIVSESETSLVPSLDHEATTYKFEFAAEGGFTLEENYVA